MIKQQYIYVYWHIHMPGVLQFMGLQRVGHDRATELTDWCWSWSSNTLATWCEELTHLKRPRCWERLNMGEGDDRGRDWVASPAQWTWVWVSPRSWWWTGKYGVLWSTGLQRVRHDGATELKWDVCSPPSSSTWLRGITRLGIGEGARTLGSCHRPNFWENRHWDWDLYARSLLVRGLRINTSGVCWKLNWVARGMINCDGDASLSLPNG